ncbi:hypothetical protein CC79DRAFT_1366089 [Sarocladium strictum]
MAAAQQHLLNHTNALVAETRAEVQALHAHTDLRFDQLDASFAGLRDRLQALTQQLEDRDTEMNNSMAQVQARLNAISTALGDAVRIPILHSVAAVRDAVGVVRDTANAIRDRVYSLDVHIVHPIQAAVIHSEEMIVDRVGEVHQAFMAAFPGQLNQILGASEGRIRDEITGSLAQASVNHTDAVTRAENAIVQASQQQTQAITNARAEIMREFNDPTGQVTVLKEDIRDRTDRISTELNASRLEMRAGQELQTYKMLPMLTLESTRHSNNAARLYNKFASCCNDRITQFRGIDNKVIRELPGSYARLYDIRGLHIAPPHTNWP